MVEHLHFAPQILRRLGEELSPNIDHGVIELVKNSYDADATFCTIELTNVSGDGAGEILIQDDGVGMSPATIRDGWLVLGTSRKLTEQKTRKFGRKPVGNKGLGRLAALRLGNKVELRTRPENEPGIEYRLEIDWRKFDEVKFVEDVPLSIKKGKAHSPPGTDISITEITHPITKKSAANLARSLVLLSGPFDDKKGFRAELKSSEFEELETRVKNAYFNEAEYLLKAKVSEDGTAKFEALDWQGKTIWNHIPDRKYKTEPATFELWIYILDKATFSKRDISIQEARSWLKEVGGVYVFEGGMRVPPYGGESADWLDMNLRRAQVAEFRPSTNTSVGRIVVENDSGTLIQKTDRDGYIENESFQELKQFASDALEWLGTNRLDKAEVEREKRREVEDENVKEAMEVASAAIEIHVPKKTGLKSKLR